MSVEIQNLTFSYHPKERKILDGVSVTANRGELLSVIGPNGSGKTTLIKCINLINEYKSGNILINGINAKSYKRSNLAKTIGYVPQMSRDSLSGTVMETILLGRYPHTTSNPTEKDVDLAFLVLQQLGITELANRNYENLSGGQKQKVLIARALVQEPEIFLFDEPTSYLDIGNQLEIMNRARELADAGKTVIIVVHDLNMAMHYSDRIVLMHAGKIVAAGKNEEVLTVENIESVYGVSVEIDADGYIRLWKK